MTAPLRAPLTAAPDPQTLRSALSKFATGVTVVTASSPRGPVGITVNSFTSVSLDPPLVLWSLAKSSNRLSVFENATTCAVHILSDMQRDLCLRFTRDAHAFMPAHTRVSSSGVPLIDNCLARFKYSRSAVHDGGDHLIFIANVGSINTSDAAPLVFFKQWLWGFSGGESVNGTWRFDLLLVSV